MNSNSPPARKRRGSASCKLIKTPKAGSHEPARLCRDVAQPGRALAWGARGRQFKSARPDHLESITYKVEMKCKTM